MRREEGTDEEGEDEEEIGEEGGENDYLETQDNHNMDLPPSQNVTFICFFS